MHTSLDTRCLIALALCTACGRIAFEPTADARDRDASDAAAPDPDLLLWFEMEASSTAEVVDSSRYANHGSCTGTECPSLVPGMRGNAFYFDGNDVVLVPTSTEHHLMTGTVAFWVRFDVVPAMAMYAQALGKPYQNGFANTWETALRDDSRVTVGGDSVVGGAFVLAPVLAGRFTHLAFTWTATQFTLYVDGAASPPISFGVAYDAQDILLGADRNNTVLASFLTGALDDVRLYRRVLDVNEIAQLATP